MTTQLPDAEATLAALAERMRGAVAHEAAFVGIYSGGAWLACRSDIPVIPVAHNAGSVWPRNSFLKYPGTVTVSIGTPTACAGKSADALNSEAQMWIEAQMQRMGSARVGS